VCVRERVLQCGYIVWILYPFSLNTEKICTSPACSRKKKSAKVSCSVIHHTSAQLPKCWFISVQVQGCTWIMVILSTFHRVCSSDSLNLLWFFKADKMHQSLSIWINCKSTICNTLMAKRTHTISINLDNSLTPLIQILLDLIDQSRI
jgi:hypothetical protein